MKEEAKEKLREESSGRRAHGSKARDRDRDREQEGKTGAAADGWNINTDRERGGMPPARCSPEKRTKRGE